MNATNDNLHQYVRVCTELILEIRHMHGLNRSKLEENWFASLSKAIMKVEGFLDVGRGEKSRFKKENKFPHKKARH
jgi:hypothetical protein